ncbi:MAG: hypothetical protein GYB68_14470 [Chloroflexi bacterium]|nr:hypothetical protein [Chloroflexota bacterium]
MMRFLRHWPALATTLLILILVGCTGSGPSADPGAAAPQITPSPAPPTIDPEGLPTNVDLPSPTPGATATLRPTVDPYGVGGITGLERLAATEGPTIYTGYLCALLFNEDEELPSGCACEQPVIQQSSFEFLDADTVRYAFRGDGFSNQWEMTRLGVNQWDTRFPLVFPDGEIRGAYLISVRFVQDGYTTTQVAEVDGNLVRCPEVKFERSNAPLPEETTPEP